MLKPNLAEAIKFLLHTYNISKIPKVGNKIYVGNALYLSRGCDDFCGGEATISKVVPGISGGDPTLYVSIKERPGVSYNWHFLSEKQHELKKRFGNNKAYPDPDYSIKSNGR